MGLSGAPQSCMGGWPPWSLHPAGWLAAAPTCSAQHLSQERTRARLAAWSQLSLAMGEAVAPVGWDVWGGESHSRAPGRWPSVHAARGPPPREGRPGARVWEGAPNPPGMSLWCATADASRPRWHTPPRSPAQLPGAGSDRTRDPAFAPHFKSLGTSQAQTRLHCYPCPRRHLMTGPPSVHSNLSPFAPPQIFKIQILTQKEQQIELER